jgi:hypothetical protein
LSSCELRWIPNRPLTLPFLLSFTVDQEAETDPVVKRSRFSIKIKKAILALLLENLNSPPVSMTHFLLGFNPQLPLEQTDLNKYVAGSRRYLWTSRS